MSALELTRVSVRHGRRLALEGADLKVAPGEVVAICGPNGAGKTTLLRAGLGLLRPASGEARLFGDPVERLSPPQRAARVGYLAQERRVAWGLPALEVAALGAPNAPPAEARARALDAMALFEVGGLAGRSVFELSGGERARVLLARLFATGAPLLVADEPAAGLDPDAQQLCLQRLRERADQGAAVLVTLHDLGLAARFADRVVVVAGGRLVADAAPREALSPARLRAAFGLDGAWIEGPDGPLLALSRPRPGPVPGSG